MLKCSFLLPSLYIYLTLYLTLSIYLSHTLSLSLSFKHSHTQSPCLPHTTLNREMRKQRKTDLTGHYEKKPGENDDDVRDNTAIKLAEKTIGDYKLKVADDYEILEECRVNATKKKSQVNIEDLFYFRLIFILFPHYFSFFPTSITMSNHLPRHNLL